MTKPLLVIDNLHMKYGDTPILRGVSISMNPSEILGVVGESGSGKSTLIHAIMGILGNDAQVTEGARIYNDVNLDSLTMEEMGKFRGSELALISQNPVKSFHPIRTIRSQLYELVRCHRSLNRDEAEEQMLALLHSMNLKDGKKILDSYSFEMSGGICQRVSIAMSMVLRPKLLLADEPTSALDVRVQAQVVNELMKTRENFGTSILIVSHNMGVIAHMADNIAVMYAGIVLEYGKKADILIHPAHTYTKNLIRAIPKLGAQAPRGIQTYKYDRKAKACPMICNCNKSASQCREQLPAIREIERGHWVRCLNI